MEFVSTKRAKNRKRKRLSKIKRRNQKNLEVRAAKRHKPNRDSNVFPVAATMTADSFWENYNTAFNWQERHKVSWWKSRCIALEQENQILRYKILEQATSSYPTYQAPESNENDINDQLQTDNDTGDDNFEFQVDDEMINFLEQSVRHKMELQKQRDNEFNKTTSTREDDEFFLKPNEDEDRMKNAELLYGSACPKIMAIETALQATVDYQKDHVNPSFWPNIPLKP